MIADPDPANGIMLCLRDDAQGCALTVQARPSVGPGLGLVLSVPEAVAAMVLSPEDCRALALALMEGMAQ